MNHVSKTTPVEITTTTTCLLLILPSLGMVKVLESEEVRLAGWMVGQHAINKTRHIALSAQQYRT